MQWQADATRRVVDALARGEKLEVRVNDETLLPYIRRGDLMVFVRASFERLRPGDFVLYREKNGAPVVQRLLKKVLVDGHVSAITASETDHSDTRCVRAAVILGRLLRIERDGRRIHCSRLNRGLLDWATEFGTRNPLAKLGDLVLTMLPPSRRPGFKPCQHREPVPVLSTDIGDIPAAWPDNPHL